MQASDIGSDSGEQPERLDRLMHTHAVSAQHAGAFRSRGLDELGIDWRIDDVGGPMRRLKRGYRHGIDGESAHTHMRGIDHPVGSGDFTFQITRNPAARRPKMPGEVAAKRIRARAVAIVHDEKRDAEVHQGERNSVSGASSADQHHSCTLRAGGSEAFRETVTPPTPVEIVTGGTAIRRNGDGVDRGGLGSLGIHRIQQRQNVLLEGIGDVGARETGSFDRIEKLRSRRPGK